MSSLNVDYLRSLGTTDPELKEFLEQNEVPQPVVDNIEMLQMVRDGIQKYCAGVSSVPVQGVQVSELEYSTSDGTRNRAVLYQPQNDLPEDGVHRPLLVMFHGGGFCLGAPEQERLLCVNAVKTLGAVCVTPAYRLAPESPSPCAVRDSWEALKWAAENASAWGADLSAGFIVGGTSAGGNIAAVLAHVARDENLSPPLTGQYLAIPLLLSPNTVPDKYKPFYTSMLQEDLDPVLLAGMKFCSECYNACHHDGVWCVPFNHPGGHEGLVPTFFQVNGADPLRDEAIIYEHVLREEYGLKTRLDVYPGLPHAHWQVYPTLNASKKFRRDQVEGLGWLLGKTPDFGEIKLNEDMSGED